MSVIRFHKQSALTATTGQQGQAAKSKQSGRRLLGNGQDNIVDQNGTGQILNTFDRANWANLLAELDKSRHSTFGDDSRVIPDFRPGIRIDGVLEKLLAAIRQDAANAIQISEGEQHVAGGAGKTLGKEAERKVISNREVVEIAIFNRVLKHDGRVKLRRRELGGEGAGVCVVRQRVT